MPLKNEEQIFCNNTLNQGNNEIFKKISKQTLWAIVMSTFAFLEICKNGPAITIIVGSGALASLFYEDPSIYCLSLLFQILSNSSSLLPSTPTPTAHSVVLFLWLKGWSRHIWCAILLNIMDVQMSSLRTLMHVLCNKA